MIALSAFIALMMAADPATATQSPDAKAKAQALLKHGAQHYQRGNFEEALAKFEAAYAAFPSPKLLLNIGHCHRELGHPVESLQAFERFLVEAESPPPRVLTEAKQAVVELSAQVGKVRIECSIMGAEIRIDGKKVGTVPIDGPLPVRPGRHELTASQPGHPRATSNVEVAAGTVETVVLKPGTLRDAGTKAGTRNDALVASRTGLDGPEKGWMLGRTWTWVATGSALVLAGGAAAAGLVMQSKFEDLDRRCGRSSGSQYPGCSPSDFATLDTWKNTANVLWGLSAAAAVTAGVLFYVEGRRVEVAPTLGPQVGFAARMRY